MFYIVSFHINVSKAEAKHKHVFYDKFAVRPLLFVTRI